jgi:hypothetical protein
MFGIGSETRDKEGNQIALADLWQTFGDFIRPDFKVLQSIQAERGRDGDVIHDSPRACRSPDPVPSRPYSRRPAFIDSSNLGISVK